MVIHSVYFTLKDKNPSVVAAFLEDTKTFGANIPNILYLQAGAALPATRPIHDKEFDIALVSAFPSQEALQTYLVHPDHLAYCARHEGNWAGIRVFDFES
ncbi:MAG: Dabb family protein [Planctomycetia bacterium]|nr:Dabb family protein [Planctomycetia bacterium]